MAEYRDLPARDVYPDLVVHGQVVPDGFAETLRRMRSRRDPRLSSVLRTAVEEGWTAAALARATELTPWGVQLRVRTERAQQDVFGIDIPPPPRQPPPPTPPGPPELPRGHAEWLRAALRIAATVNGDTAADDPRREIAHEVTAELAQLVDDGPMTLAQVARQLGMRWGTLKARLTRYGYRPLPPSSRGQQTAPAVGQPRGSHANARRSPARPLTERERDTLAALAPEERPEHIRLLAVQGVRYADIGVVLNLSKSRVADLAGHGRAPVLVQTLPWTFVGFLRSLRDDRDPGLNAILAVAREWWTDTTLGRALGISAHAVRRRAARSRAHHPPHGDPGDDEIAPAVGP
jgi:hypothetical protein